MVRFDSSPFTHESHSHECSQRIGLVELAIADCLFWKDGEIDYLRISITM